MPRFSAPTLLLILTLFLLEGCAHQKADAPSPTTPPTQSSHGWFSGLVEDEEPTPTPAANIWPEIAQQLTLTAYWGQPRVKKEITFYSKNKKFFEAMTNNGGPYIQYVWSEIKKANLPADLIILPMIESGFDPYVYSPSKAAGIWQFVPATGRLYGLKQTGSYDGRRDITASTRAALAYLKRLNQEMNGDWLLTLAAYNAGEMNIKRAIEANQKKGKKTDYFSLNLSKETSMFVPRILAIGKMLNDPSKWGINLQPIPDAPYFAEIKLTKSSSFANLAAQGDISIEELKRLNPGYRKNAQTTDKQYSFLVPYDIVQRYTAEPIEITDTQQEVIANETVDELTASKAVNLIHTVKEKDTLAKLAKQYDVTTQQIANANKIKANAALKLGQQIIIPVKVAANNIKQQKHYTIESGDTLSTIAKRFALSAEKIQTWNPQINPNNLKVGSTLVLYPNTH